MKNLKVLFSAVVIVFAFFACSPNHEEVMPDQGNQNIEKFDVKKTEGGMEGVPGRR